MKHPIRIGIAAFATTAMLILASGALGPLPS
jgi:hypothetical protein